MLAASLMPVGSRAAIRDKETQFLVGAGLCRVRARPDDKVRLFLRSVDKNRQNTDAEILGEAKDGKFKFEKMGVFHNPSI
jgi:hypothetical protein